MASSSTYAFFHCHYAFQNFPFFCVTLCVCCMLCIMRLRRILQSMQHTQDDTKERGLLKCVVAVKECVRGGGRHLQDVIFKHWYCGLLSLKSQVGMVQFLSINFFSWISSILGGFLKVPVFWVTLYYVLGLCHDISLACCNVLKDRGKDSLDRQDKKM